MLLFLAINIPACLVAPAFAYLEACWAGQEACSCLADLPCSEAAWVVLEYSAAAFGMMVVSGVVAEGEGSVGSSWVASAEACS